MSNFEVVIEAVKRIALWSGSVALLTLGIVYIINMFLDDWSQ